MLIFRWAVHKSQAMAALLHHQPFEPNRAQSGPEHNGLLKSCVFSNPLCSGGWGGEGGDIFSNPFWGLV